MIVIYCPPAIMKRSFVAASIVALAVLFGQGGGLVLAAICPHLRAEQPDNSCHAASQRVAEDHQPVEQVGHAFATEGTDVRCNHCVVHSRHKREESALQKANTSQRADDRKATVPVFKVEPPALLKASAWGAKTESPPGSTARLHVLLNVFRI